MSLARAFGGLWLFAGLIKLFSRSFGLIQPFLLREFLKSVPSSAPNARLVSLFWVLMMCVSGVSATLLSTQCSVRVNKVRISMKQALRQFLYGKSLRLSLQAKAKFGMGTLTNLLSNDTPRIIAFIHYGHYLWGAPFQVRFAARSRVFFCH
jgi:ATP-binding cassette, subfamily C (CFTR/MRP), member 1